MFKGLNSFVTMLTDCYHRHRANLALLRDVVNVLDHDGIQPGRDFATFRSAIGPTSGLGVELVGVRSFALQLRIADILVNTTLDGPLLFRSSDRRSVFFGSYCSDPTQFAHRARSLRAQLQHEVGTDGFEMSPHHALIEINVRHALQEAGLLGVDPFIESDDGGTSVTFSDLPNEETAHKVHRALVKELEEFPLSVRFEDRERWVVFFDRRNCSLEDE